MAANDSPRTSPDLPWNRRSAAAPAIAGVTPWDQVEGDLADVEGLCFADVDALPDDLRRCTKLRRLRVRGGDLKRLPDFVFDLPLEALEVDRAALASLPAGVARATRLRVLSLRDNKLRALPPEIGRLERLEILDVSENTLSREGLPDAIGDLASLTTLELGSTHLTALPASLGRLRALRHLDVSGSPKLVELPASLGACERLETLTADACKRLEGLPDAVFPNLRALDLCDSKKVGAVSAGFFASPHLAWVDLSELKQKEVPAGLRTSAATLEVLKLFNCGLTRVPEWIGELTWLWELELGGNRIKALPASIGELRELRELRVGWNKLKELPPELGRLSRLTQLHACYCGLTSLPAELAELTALTDAEVQNNDLKMTREEVKERYFPRAALDKAHLYQNHF